MVTITRRGTLGLGLVAALTLGAGGRSFAAEPINIGCPTPSIVAES